MFNFHMKITSLLFDIFSIHILVILYFHSIIECIIFKFNSLVQIQIKNVNFRIIEIKKIEIKNYAKFITKKKFYKFYNNWTLTTDICFNFKYAK